MPEILSNNETGHGILLVEDVQAMRLYLRLIFEGAGFQVIEAENLQEARRYLQGGDCPGTILLDLELPDGHGLDLIRDVPEGVAVVALSADDSRETELQCRRAGCVAVLSKSDDLSDIGQVIESIKHQSLPAIETPGQQSELAVKYDGYLVETRINLQRARQVRDFDEARRIAHRLRGTAVHFGYGEIGRGALAVSNALASGNINQIESAIEQLTDQLVEATAFSQVS
jgi:CheY-like chemotaxis protein